MKSTLYPSDWGNASLEEVSIHIIGGDWGKDPDFLDQEYESVACIRGAEFKNWKRDFGKTAVIRKVKCSSLSTRNLLENDILVEISGGGPDQPVGRTVLIDEKVLNQHKLPLVCTNFLRLVRLNNNINAVFVNRYLEFFYNSGEVTKYQSGSNNLRNLKFKDYSALKMPLPPLAEQKIIAEKLDTLLAQVESTKARLEQIPQILKRFRQAVLAAVVNGKLSKNTKQWEIYLLKNICTSISDGDHQAPPKSETGIPFLVISDVNKGVIDFDNVSRWVPESYYQSLKEIRKPYQYDILYTVTGSYGIPVIVNNNKPFCFQRHIAIIKPNRNLIDHRFLAFYLESPQIFKHASDVATGTAQKTVSLSSLRNFEISVPPLKEQHEIVRRVEQLFAYADTIEKQVNNALARVNNLTQSILAKAFRGELTAQWRAENPELISGENSAAALLEKIKAERAASGGKKASRKI